MGPVNSPSALASPAVPNPNLLSSDALRGCVSRRFFAHADRFDVMDSDFRVFVALTSFVDARYVTPEGNPLVFASRELIFGLSNISERTLQQVLNRLEDAGLISRGRRTVDGVLIPRAIELLLPPEGGLEAAVARMKKKIEPEGPMLPFGTEEFDASESAARRALTVAPRFCSGEGESAARRALTVAPRFSEPPDTTMNAGAKTKQTLSVVVLREQQDSVCSRIVSEPALALDDAWADALTRAGADPKPIPVLMALGFSGGDAVEISQAPSCTLPQIRIGLGVIVEYRDKGRAMLSPMGLLRTSIERGYSLADAPGNRPAGSGGAGPKRGAFKATNDPEADRARADAAKQRILEEARAVHAAKDLHADKARELSPLPAPEIDALIDLAIEDQPLCRAIFERRRLTWRDSAPLVNAIHALAVNTGSIETRLPGVAQSVSESATR